MSPDTIVPIVFLGGDSLVNRTTLVKAKERMPARGTQRFSYLLTLLTTTLASPLLLLPMLFENLLTFLLLFFVHTFS